MRIRFKLPDGRLLDVKPECRAPMLTGLVFAFVGDVGDAVLLSAEPPPVNALEYVWSQNETTRN